MIGAEKKMDPVLGLNKFRDRSAPSLSDDGHGRALKAAAARAATRGVSTPTRTHAHHSNQRGLLYMWVGVVHLSLVATTSATRHACSERHLERHTFVSTCANVRTCCAISVRPMLSC